MMGPVWVICPKGSPWLCSGAVVKKCEGNFDIHYDLIVIVVGYGQVTIAKGVGEKGQNQLDTMLEHIVQCIATGLPLAIDLRKLSET
jgi:hypothetical protein